jgi:hypothetical protein
MKNDRIYFLFSEVDRSKCWNKIYLILIKVRDISKRCTKKCILVHIVLLKHFTRVWPDNGLSTVWAQKNVSNTLPNCRPAVWLATGKITNHETSNYKFKTAKISVGQISHNFPLPPHPPLTPTYPVFLAPTTIKTIQWLSQCHLFCL